MFSAQEQQNHYALECLRLASDCRTLAAECRTLAQGVNLPNLRMRLLRMSDMWTALADQALGPKI